MEGSLQSFKNNRIEQLEEDLEVLRCENEVLRNRLSEKCEKCGGDASAKCVEDVILSDTISLMNLDNLIRSNLEESRNSNDF